MVNDKPLSSACRNVFQSSDESVLSEQLTQKWIALIRRRKKSQRPAEGGDIP